MESKDYYQTLGVSRDVSKDELKKAYRKLARKYHPDVSKESHAETKFKEVAEAYEALKDPEKRANYDQFGTNSTGGHSFTPPPHWGRGGRRNNFFPQGADVNTKITISLEDAFFGTKKTIRRPSGATQTGTLDVKIPVGIEAGNKIRLTGQGKAGMGGSQPGDLYLEIAIAPHSHYSLKDKDIYLDLALTPWEAALGTTLTVPTLAGRIKLKIPAGAKSGQKMRLKGRGLFAKQAGDQFVVLHIQTPPAETDEAIQFYQQMAEQFNFNPREALKNL